MIGDERGHYEDVPSLANQLQCIELKLIERFKERKVDDCGDAIALLENPDWLKGYFEHLGYEYLPPLPVVRKSGGTLFTTAGVQQLDNVIHDGAPLPLGRKITFQPVFRTQYIDCVEEGTSTSFINPSSLEVNPTPEQHFNSLSNWLSVLQAFGFYPNQVSFSSSEETPSWDGKSFNAHVTRIYYRGVEVGDASYIYNFPQHGRTNLTVSDIGFGLERLRWVLSEQSYFAHLGFPEEVQSLDGVALDHLRTLTLIAGNGLYPSNKEQGYRFRQLSKKLIEQNIVTQSQALNLIQYAYQTWSLWTELSVPLDVVQERIDIENQRNYNRAVLKALEPIRGVIDLGINVQSKEFLKRLKGTKAQKEDAEIIERIIYLSL